MVMVISAAVSPRLAPTAKVAVATIVAYIKIARIHQGRPAERNVLTAGRPASIGRGFTLGGWPGGLSEALVRFDVALAGGLDDVGRDGRPGSRPVPVDGPGPVADDLLVERALWPPRLPRLGGPQTRGVRRQHLVGEDERPVRCPAELDLGVGDDDPPGQRDAVT